MDDLFSVIGKLYVDVSRLQQYAEMLQNKVKDLENQLLPSNQPKPQKDK